MKLFSCFIFLCFFLNDFTYAYDLNLRSFNSKIHTFQNLNKKTQRPFSSSNAFFPKKAFHSIHQSTDPSNFLLAESKKAKKSELKWPNPPMAKHKRTSKTRKNLSIIAFSGLSGAILGLSTISFSSQPGKASSNITIGFSIGVLIGSLLTLYNTVKASSLHKKKISEFQKTDSF